MIVYNERPTEKSLRQAEEKKVCLNLHLILNLKLTKKISVRLERS